jgi:glycosyltransferase involved in cell wall biosynthesis
MIDPRNPDFHNHSVASSRPVLEYAQLDQDVKPAASIVTPFYNVNPSEFEETAKSILQQSFQQWEWLIINDGSDSTSSVELLTIYQNIDQRVRVIDHAENLGISAARNTGFQSSQTDYVLLVDSDDLLEPTALEKWFWFLRSFSEYGFVKGYSIGFGARQYLWQKGFHLREAFLEENQVDPTSMIRKSVWEVVGGFDESIRDGLEDWDFWLRCADHGFWGTTIPEYLNHYRCREKHTDRWKNLTPRNLRTFRKKLRQRYPRLWEVGMPDIQPIRPADNLQCTEKIFFNPLQKKSPSMLMLLPWLTTGGADKFNLDLLEQLTQNDWQVSIATTLYGDHSWLPEFERYTPDIFILSHFLKAVHFLQFITYLIQSRQFDTVFISHSELAYLLLPYLRYQFPDVSFVDYCHVVETGWKEGGYPRMSVQNQDYLNHSFTSSQQLRSWMIEQGGNSEKITVCYTGIDPEKWKPNAYLRQQTRKKISITSDIPLILFVGRFCEQKQPELFVETIRIINQNGHSIRALMAGSGPKFANVQRLVRRHRLEKTITLTGDVPNHEILALLNAADIFFLPSAWEGISLSIYEAMACALPVMAADVGGQSELLTPECGLLVSHPRSASCYAEALTNLLTWPDEQIAMGQNARNKIVQSFSLDSLITTMSVAYKTPLCVHQNNLANPPQSRQSYQKAQSYLNQNGSHIALLDYKHNIQSRIGYQIYIRLRSLFGPIYRAIYRYRPQSATTIRDFVIHKLFIL